MKILIPIMAGISSLPFAACHKADTGNRPLIPSLTCRAGNNPISFQQVSVTGETIGNLHTTLITGKYADTSSLKGNISLRVLGDTAGLYKGQDILAAYMDNNGTTWNNTADNNNTVSVDQLNKIPDGRVQGSFTLTMTNGRGNTLSLSNGYFTALYKE